MTALSPLLEKYRALLALRGRREAVEAEGRDRFQPEEAAERRRAFRALARRFPSALSELELPADELARRKALVKRALEGGPAPEERAWAEGMAELHLGLRLLLGMRRFLLRGGADARAFFDRCRRFEERARARGHAGRDAAGWAAALGIPPEELYAFVAHPPGGRWRPHLEAALGLRPAIGLNGEEGRATRRRVSPGGSPPR